MWLVDAKVQQEDNQRIFTHRFTLLDNRKALNEIAVKIFGGEGDGHTFRTNIAIGKVNLGQIHVGFLQTVTGFGGEIGDGCVTVITLSFILPLLLSLWKTCLSVVPLAREPQDTSRTLSARATLISTRAVDDQIGAFALREDAGEVHIGMIEREAHVGPIEYHACVESSPFWAIDGATIYVGEQRLNAKRIIFDTTSQFIRGPKEDVDQLYDGINGLLKAFHEDSGLYSIPCYSQLQRVGIGLDRDWWIEPKQ